MQGQARPCVQHHHYCRCKMSNRAAGPVWVDADEINCPTGASTMTSSVFDNAICGNVERSQTYITMTSYFFVDPVWLQPRCLPGQSPGTPCLPFLVRVSPQVCAEPCRHPACPASSMCLSACLCRTRGDPALPFHHLPVAATLRKAAAAAAAEQDFLTAIRLRLKAAVIAGQTHQAEHCSRCLRGVAQVVFLLIWCVCITLGQACCCVCITLVVMQYIRHARWESRSGCWWKAVYCV